MELLISAFIVMGVAALFVVGDRRLGSQERSALAGYLLAGRDEASAAHAVPSAFLQWFDGLLKVREVRVGGRRLHLPSFRRSALLSLIALTFAAAMWTAKKGLFDPEQINNGVLNVRVGLPLLLLYAAGAFVSNLVPDYLSLVQSRWVLERMRRSDSLARQFAWLVLDLALTGLTVFVVLWLTARTLMPLVPVEYEHFIGCLRAEDLTLAEFGRIYWGGLTFSSPIGTQNYDVAGVYIYSSFLTSFWVWLFMASSLLMKLAAMVPGVRKLLLDEARTRTSPLRAMSLAAALVALSAFAAPHVLGALGFTSPAGQAQVGWVTGSQSHHERMELCRERQRARAWRY